MKSPIYLDSDILRRITKGQWINCPEKIEFFGIGSHGQLEEGFLSFAIALHKWRRTKVDIEYELLKIFRKKATAIVVDSIEYTTYFSKPMLVVDDVNFAMEQCARYVRDTLDPKRVLVGGSVGKTGFKTQLHHLLSSQTPTHAVINSANVKLPILYSLLSLEHHHKVEIVEVSGAARFDVGVERSNIVSPHYVVFTNVTPNHMRVHKTIDNFIKAKASAVVGLVNNGDCILNQDMPLFPEMLNQIESLRKDINIHTFGEKSGDAFILEKTFLQESFSWHIKASVCEEFVEYDIPFFQHHAPLQSVAALLCGKVMGYNIQELSKSYGNLLCYETMGRLFEIRKGEDKFFYYDQSLRGAISGMESALLDLNNIKGTRRIIAVIGGSSTEVDNSFTKEQHHHLAKCLNNSAIDILYTTGPFMEYVHDNLNNKMQDAHRFHSDDKEKIFNDLKNQLQSKDIVFIMGNGYLKLASLSSKLFALGSRYQIK